MARPNKKRKVPGVALVIQPARGWVKFELELELAKYNQANLHAKHILAQKLSVGKLGALAKFASSVPT